MYRVRFNGDVMELEENISETTGLGLGVHTTIRPSGCEELLHLRWSEGQLCLALIALQPAGSSSLPL